MPPPRPTRWAASWTASSAWASRATRTGRRHPLPHRRPRRPQPRPPRQPPPPPPPPTPTPTPPPPAVDVAVDTGIAGNTANSLGTVETCNSIAAVGDTLEIDVVVRGVPPYDPGSGSGGLVGFQFDLLYDPTVVNVVGFDARMMLTADGEAMLFSLSDPVPDNDGDFLAAALDFSTSYESGDGVLIRITLQAVGNGTSLLDLNELGSGNGVPLILDSANPYPLSEVGDGEVGVEGSCARALLKAPIRGHGPLRPRVSAAL